MKKVYVAIGLPSSGKSTWMDHYMRNRAHTIINADSIREEITGSEGDVSRDSEVWPILFERYKQALLSKEIEYIGVTNTSVKFRDRKKYFEVADRLGIESEFYAVLFPPNVEACLELQKTRKRKVPEFVFERMSSQFDFNFQKNNEYFEDCFVVFTEDIVDKLKGGK